MRKRMTSLLLTLVMLLSLVPAMGVTASAEETWETITTYEQFEAAMTANGQCNVKLDADIDTAALNSGMGLLDTLTVKGQKQLDLNGHTLRLFTQKSALGDLIKVVNSSLTLSDSSTAQTGRILGVTKGDADVLINVWENGKFTMNSGKLEVEVYTGSLRGVLWRRTIDCHYGGEVVINGGTLYVPPETYEDSNAYTTQFFDEFDDLHNGSCGYTLITNNNSKVTINGGTFQGPVRMNAGNSKWNKTTSRVIITGGTFEKDVVLNGAGSTTGDGKVTLAEIKGGTFLGKVQAWAAASFDSSFSTPEVVISGGDFSKEFWLRPKFPLVNDKEQEGMAYQVAAKLNGGTFHEGFSADKNYENYVYSASAVKQRLNASEIYQLADKLLGQSAIQTGNGTFAAQDYNSYNKYITNYRKSEHDSGGYAFIIKAVNNQPTTIIPNAWGIIDVTLDGTTPISYAKNWNGAAVEIDNSKAHTITFKWNDLASELETAGYSYDAKCEHYISGSSAVQKTEKIDTNKTTSHTVTIEKGADPKVYSYDLQLNLQKDGSNVGIFTNDHIVKLVVNQAEVVVPDPTLEGKVYYTSGIVYGSRISTGTGDLPDGFDRDKLLYQWQRSTDSGSIWTDIAGETKGSYTPVAADMGKDVRIRVKITAEGYLGEIVGAAVKVSKAANNEYPEVIQLEAVKDSEGHYIGFEINNYDPKYEYVYNTTDTPKWNENQIGSATVTDLESDKTYYVFARFKETKTHTAGSIVSKNSIRLYGYVPLQYVSLEGYDSGNTIYIKKGESVELKVSADPSNANSWQKITFKESGTATGYITVDNAEIPANDENAASFPDDYTITIKGVSTGSSTLSASYPSSPPSAYGTWPVVVYDDSTVTNALRLKNVYTYEDITLSVNDEAELPTDLPKLLPENSGYRLEWRILEGGTSGGYMHVTENANIKLEDGKIMPRAAHTGSPTSTRLELVAVKEGKPIKSLSPSSVFNVTVTEAPTIDLIDLTVAPRQVNLELNATYQLSAVKQPANAEGTLEWESSNTGVATVDKKTGEVTAKAQGTAIITVTCGTKSASCTVTVDHQQHDYSGQPYLYLDPGNHYQECKAGDGYNIQAHEFTAWADNGNGTHSRHCNVCKKSGEAEFYTETANHNCQWVVDDAATPNAAGKQHEECVDCHAKRSENTEIPMLTSIMVEHLTVAKPVKDGVATAPTTTDSTYYVANTEWMTKDGTPLAIGDKFQPGTVYTVKITLKTAGAGVFSAKSTYNDIEGKKATLTSALTGDNYADSVILTYTFDKTAGGYHPGTGTGTGTTTYPITVKSAKNGDVTASHKSASKGTTVILTVDPDKGYVLDTLTVLDGKDKEIKLTEKNGKFTFTMPASKVTVAATFKASAPTGKNPFIDVPAGSYYEDAVVWAVEKGITSGTSAVTFDPNGNCTRAQAVTFLWRAAGSPAPKTKVMPFTDVPSGSYYYDAVLWAMEQGITKGTSDTAFSPNASCTRAQIVTFLWRANGSPAVSGNSAFTDVASDAYYAAAVAWAEKNGVTGGIGNGLFGSNNNCTRAQIVTFLYRSVK